MLFVALLRWTLSRGDPQAMGDGEVLALDVGRVGLLVGLIGCSMLTFLCVLLGKLIVVTVVTLCVIAAAAAVLDVVFPSLLGRAVILTSDKSEWTKGGLR